MFKKKHLSYRYFLFIIIFLQIFILAALTLYLTATYLPPIDARSRVVVVPDLIGSAYTSNSPLVSEEIFSVHLEYRTDETVSPGIILDQDPPANATRRVIPGASPCQLRLTISTGKSKVSLPALVGKDIREATAMLHALGLTVLIEKAETSDIPAGQVVAMLPDADTQLSPGDSVTLTESVMPNTRTVKVPSVVGMTQSGANATLVLRGLRPGTPEYEASDKEPGTVLSQRPLPNTLVPYGCEATLVISNGRSDRYPPSSQPLENDPWEE